MSAFPQSVTPEGVAKALGNGFEDRVQRIQRLKPPPFLGLGIDLERCGRIYRKILFLRLCLRSRRGAETYIRSNSTI